MVPRGRATAGADGAHEAGHVIGKAYRKCHFPTDRILKALAILWF